MILFPCLPCHKMNKIMSLICEFNLRFNHCFNEMIRVFIMLFNEFRSNNLNLKGNNNTIHILNCVIISAGPIHVICVFSFLVFEQILKLDNFSSLTSSRNLLSNGILLTSSSVLQKIEDYDVNQCIKIIT